MDSDTITRHLQGVVIRLARAFHHDNSPPLGQLRGREQWKKLDDAFMRLDFHLAETERNTPPPIEHGDDPAENVRIRGQRSNWSYQSDLAKDAPREEARLPVQKAGPEGQPGEWLRLRSTLHIRRGDQLWSLESGKPPRRVWQALSDARLSSREESLSQQAVLTVVHGTPGVSDEPSTVLHLNTAPVTIFRPDVTVQNSSGVTT
jgi:hypothetical protein